MVKSGSLSKRSRRVRRVVKTKRSKVRRSVKSRRSKVRRSVKSRRSKARRSVKSKRIKTRSVKSRRSKVRRSVKSKRIKTRSVKSRRSKVRSSAKSKRRRSMSSRRRRSRKVSKTRVLTNKAKHAIETKIDDLRSSVINGTGWENKLSVLIYAILLVQVIHFNHPNVVKDIIKMVISKLDINVNDLADYGKLVKIVSNVANEVMNVYYAYFK